MIKIVGEYKMTDKYNCMVMEYLDWLYNKYNCMVMEYLDWF